MFFFFSPTDGGFVRVYVPSMRPSGGSSAVEQWTVKCYGADIHWSGVQISLPGIFCDSGLRVPNRIRFRNRASVIRSYHGESTASHPNCEVKHRWARSVLW